MSDTERRFPEAFWHITPRRATVLRELADGRTEREAAKNLGVSYDAVRSSVAELKTVVDRSDVRDLGRWWRAQRDAWVEFLAELAGASSR